MFTSDAAKLIGITPKALRSFLRTHAHGVGSGARYEFSYDEVERLRDDYWAAQPKSTSKRKHEDEGTPGLPIDWLRDPDKHIHFLAEREERLERMSRRLQEAGLAVPQMTEHDLRVNNRAIARAILQGVSE